jgi:formamidopyrimidine-DNA glycosylase
MPELPEVECLTRAVRHVLQGQQIQQVQFFRRDLRGEIPIEQFQATMLSRPIRRVYRRSKYMLVEVEGSVGIFHLGMSGQIMCLDQPEPVYPHTHAIFQISPTSPKPVYLHYIDPRRFGWITCCAGSELADHPFFKHLGPEPLATDDLLNYLWQKSRKKVVAIKNFLMDARVLVGVGNIYANEALFRAGIRPTRPTHRVRQKEFAALVPAIRQTLSEAIEAGGTSFRDYLHPDGSPGYFKVALRVYDRAGEPCVECGAEIQEVRLSGRATYFCKRCQK